MSYHNMGFGFDSEIDTEITNLADGSMQDLHIAFMAPSMSPDASTHTEFKPERWPISSVQKR